MRKTIHVGTDVDLRIIGLYAFGVMLYLWWRETQARNRQARALEQQTQVMKADSEHYPDPDGLHYPRGHPKASRVVEVEGSDEEEDE